MKIRTKNYEVKNSYEAAEKLNGIVLQDDDVLVSFDVVNLFPSIPLQDALRNLEEQLFDKGIPRLRTSHFNVAHWNVYGKKPFPVQKKAL